MTSLRPPAVNPESVEQRVGTGYPQPYQAEVKLRRMRTHIDAFMATVSPGAERVATY